MKCGFIRVTYIKGERVKYVTTEELKRIRPSVIKTQEACTGNLNVNISPEIQYEDYYDGEGDDLGSAHLDIEWVCTAGHKPVIGPFDYQSDMEEWINKQLDADSRTMDISLRMDWK